MDEEGRGLEEALLLCWLLSADEGHIAHHFRRQLEARVGRGRAASGLTTKTGVKKRARIFTVL